MCLCEICIPVLNFTTASVSIFLRFGGLSSECSWSCDLLLSLATMTQLWPTVSVGEGKRIRLQCGLQ